MSVNCLHWSFGVQLVRKPSLAHSGGPSVPPRTPNESPQLTDLDLRKRSSRLFFPLLFEGPV